MLVQEIMTAEPACCTPATSLCEVAKMMVTRDCGAIPVVEGGDRAMRVIGVVTDRDIAIRAVAAGRSPQGTTVQDVMSHPVACVPHTATAEECLALMEQNQIRRAPVVDQAGCLVGMVSQADVARAMPQPQVAELVREVSKGFDSAHAM